MAWKDAEPQIDEHIGFFFQDTAANALERFGVSMLPTAVLPSLFVVWLQVACYSAVSSRYVAL